MKNTESIFEQRDLCRRRDQEFLALYHPTLDAFLAKGMSESKARRAAVQFTIANGHPHYHVNYERAYRCVCHLLSEAEKKGNGAQTFRTNANQGVAESRLRRQMWYEITSRVQQLIAQGMSIPRAIDHVLDHCRASRFFISPVTALTKICPQARSRAIRC